MDEMQATYDRIAEHFSATREYAWPETEEFLADRQGELALDLGCGNGRNAELLATCADRVVGLDLSRGLLREARARASERDFAVDLVQGNAASIPIRSDCVDLCVYIATLHHLRSREARIASLDELARVLQADGQALVSVWSTEHDRFETEEGFDTTVDWTLPGGETVPRFYHIYAPDEFRDDLADSGLRPLDVFISSGNCYAVVGPD